jgi:hypothetical protein
MPTLSALSSNPELQSYAQGAARQNISPIADFIAPMVEVATSVGHYKKYDSAHRFKVPDTRRALRGRATELNWNVTDATYNCAPNAIDVPVDKLEALEMGSAMDAIKEGADDAAEVAGLAHEKAVIDAALTAAGSGTDSNFASDAVYPIKLIDAAIIAVAKAGKHSNLMEVAIVFGPSAFLNYKNNKNVMAAKSGGGKAMAVGLDDVRALQLGNPEARLSTMIYDAAAEGIAESMSFLLDTAILIFLRKPNPTRRDPSFMKTFRLRNSILRPRIYTRDDGRVDVAAFDWSEDVEVTNSAAVIRINGNAS